MVEWSLLREPIEISCSTANHLTSIMSTFNGRPSTDLKNVFNDFELEEVNVTLSATCKNFKIHEIAPEIRMLTLLGLMFVVVVGPVILSLVIRRCYKSKHPNPKNRKEDFIFYRIPRNNESGSVKTDVVVTNKRKTARQEKSAVMNTPLIDAVSAERVEIERIRASIYNPNTFSLTNQVFATMREEKQVPPTQKSVGVYSFDFSNGNSNASSETINDRYWKVRFPAEESFETPFTPDHSTSTVTFTPQKPTVYIDNDNFV